MKKITTLLSVLIVMSFFPVLGQTQFWVDDFEDAGYPSSGIRTPSNEGGIGFPYSSYFVRTTNAEINTAFGSYSGFNGSKFWATEDNDGVWSGGEEQQIVFSSIDISGKNGITFKGLFAANNINVPLKTKHLDILIMII